MPSGSDPDQSMLRIAMWNIWGFSWEWRRRRPLVAAELNDLAPDILFLHEARAARNEWESSQSTPEQVAADTGIPLIEWIDAPTVHSSARMGPALLAHTPPAATSRVRLAGRDSVEDLGYHEPWLLAAEWQIGGSRVVVAATHLPASSLRDAQEVSVSALADSLLALRDRADLLVLIGDLNLQPHSPRLYRLMQAVDLESEPRLSSTPPTWPTSSPIFNRQALDSGQPEWVHHPDAPPIRIDHLLVHRRDGASVQITDTGRFGTNHRDGDLFASDHWGLWVDLAIE